MTKSISIFEPKKGFFISNENLILIFLTVTLFILVILQRIPNFDFGNMITFISIIWVLYIFGLLISNFFRYQHINGEFIGEMKLENDSILIEKKTYLINDINEIEIYCEDIKGQFVNSTLEFSPHLSNGLNNVIRLKLKNGEKVSYSFLQTEREQVKYFKKELTEYFTRGKMSWLHLLTILDMNDYDEIQKFKKELK